MKVTSAIVVASRYFGIRFRVSDVNFFLKIATRQLPGSMCLIINANE